jgi:hypothetical protein
MKSIEIIVSLMGEVQIDAIGFKGPDCEQATKFLEEALGVAQEKVKKPEFSRQNKSNNQQKVGL